MPKQPKPKIVVIGGGTGSFTLLQELKNYTDNLTALVNMADDGGSSGQLRDELGVLPPGDIRQCLVALSESSQLRTLFEYRFNKGILKGHSFGNLFLSALEKTTNDFGEAVRLAGETLRIRGQVLPITTNKTHLVAKMANGKKLKGEFKTSHANFGKHLRPGISLEPAATIMPAANRAITDADIVVIAPGNLYGSLAPALVVKGVKEALAKTKAKVVYVCNLVTKPGQTDGFEVHDYVSEIERFIGNPAIDFVFYNTKKPTPQLLSKYVHQGEYLVGYDLNTLAKQHYRSVGLSLIAREPVKAGPVDAIGHARSLIRHNADVVAQKLLEIANDE